MNERIRQLAEQMGWEEMGADLYGKSMDGCMTIHALEKFALLLMREIAMVQITHQVGMDLENKKMDDPAKELNYAVIEHFGVGK
jgi:hypothetical protein